MMIRSLTKNILPIVAVMGFEIAALSAAAQVFIYLKSGAWMTVTLGHVLASVGISPPPPQWMDGSVYDMAWNEPLALTALLVGLVAATYAGIDRLESDEAKPSFVYP